MKFLTVLVASSIINFQQPVHTPTTEHDVDNKKLEQIATDYLKFRIPDADFIQTTVLDKNNSLDFDVYMAFSADSTPVNTCKIHLHKYEKQLVKLKEISCVNYQKKVGFKENINSSFYD